MLYEAAIRHTKRATECVEKKDIPGKGAAIGKVHDIITELVATLDFNLGVRLLVSWNACTILLQSSFCKANIENSVDKLKSVQRILETLLEGWRGAVEQVNKGATK